MTFCLPLLLLHVRCLRLLLSLLRERRLRLDPLGGGMMVPALIPVTEIVEVTDVGSGVHIPGQGIIRRLQFLLHA